MLAKFHVNPTDHSPHVQSTLMQIVQSLQENSHHTWEDTPSQGNVQKLLLSL